MNDAESHFCQACGHALPEQLASTKTSRTLTKPVPDLTDEVLIGPAQPHQPIAVAPRFDAGALTELPVHVPMLAVDAVQPHEKQHKPAYRVPVLLALGGAASLALAVWIWPRMEPSGPPTRRQVPVAAVEAVPVLAIKPANGAAAAPDAVARADAALAHANAAAEAAVQPAARIKEAAQAETRRTPTERAQVTQRQAVELAAIQRASVQRTPAKPAAPPPECTPQVDALGLCAPGATIKGR